MPKLKQEKQGEVNIGSMRKITIKKKSRTSDGQGGFTFSYSNVVQPYAERISLSASEIVRAKQLEAPVTHAFKLRYVNGINNQMVIDDGAILYNIRGIIPLDNKNRYIKILADSGGVI